MTYPEVVRPANTSSEETWRNACTYAGLLRVHVEEHIWKAPPMGEIAWAPTTMNRGGRDRNVCDPGRRRWHSTDDTRLEVSANLAEKSQLQSSLERSGDLTWWISVSYVDRRDKRFRKVPRTECDSTDNMVLELFLQLRRSRSWSGRLLEDTKFLAHVSHTEEHSFCQWKTGCKMRTLNYRDQFIPAFFVWWNSDSFYKVCNLHKVSYAYDRSSRISALREY